MTRWVLRLSVLIKDLYKLNIRELFEIKADEVGNIEVFAFGSAYTRQIDVSNAVCDLELAITSESVIHADPTVIIALRRTGTFEEFVECRLRQHIAVRPALACHFDGRQVIFVTKLVCKIDIDQCVCRR